MLTSLRTLQHCTEAPAHSTVEETTITIDQGLTFCNTTTIPHASDCFGIRFATRRGPAVSRVARFSDLQQCCGIVAHIRKETSSIEYSQCNEIQLSERSQINRFAGVADR